MKPGPVPHPMATLLTPTPAVPLRHYLSPKADLEKDGPKLAVCGVKGARGPRTAEVYELAVCPRCARKVEP